MNICKIESKITIILVFFMSISCGVSALDNITGSTVQLSSCTGPVETFLDESKLLGYTLMKI